MKTAAEENANELFRYIIAKRLPVRDIDTYDCIDGINRYSYVVTALTMLNRRITINYKGNNSIMMWWSMGEEIETSAKEAKRKMIRLIMLDEKNKDVTFFERHPE